MGAKIFGEFVKFIFEMGLKNKLIAKRDELRIKKAIQEFAEQHFNDNCMNLPRQSEIDFGGLQEYLNEKLHDEINGYLLNTNRSIRMRHKEVILAKAYDRAQAKSKPQKDEVDIFVNVALDIAIECYKNMLGTKDVFSANIIIDGISDPMQNGFSTISEEIKDLKKITMEASSVNTPHNTPHELTNPAPLAGNAFIHRDDTVDKLYNAIKQNQKFALINGLGGIGKTTVARALYHKVRDKFKHVAWVEYQNSIKDSLLNSFTTFNHLQNKDDIYNAIVDFLRNAKTDTIIFVDNVSDDHDGITFLEQLEANVVLTSRLEEIGNFTTFTLEFLTEEQCVEIFYKYYKHHKYDKTKKHKDVVRRLVQLVKCHTLSVELLARAANRPSYPLDKYEADLKEKGFGYPDKSFKIGDKVNKQTIAQHLAKLFELVGVNDEQKRILKNFSILPSVEIPAEVKTWLGCHIDDISRLVELGWLYEQEESYEMHPMIKESIGLQHKVQYEDCAEMIEYMSSDEYIKQTDIYTTVHVRLNIAEAVMCYFYDVEKEEVSMLFCIIARAYRYQGEYNKALEWQNKTRELREKILGTEHTSTATTYNNIAIVYKKQGEFDMALEWHKKALIIKEKTLSIEHPSTAITYNNIATVYEDQGEYDMALEWYTKALIVDEKALGTEHPSTATTYNNIAGVYSEQGEYEIALEWYKKALKINKRILGLDHPTTAMNYNNIATVYGNQSKYDKALEWYQKALTIREKFLGTNHPSTALTYNNMAVAYHRQSEFTKALQFYIKSFYCRIVKLGQNHPRTIATKKGVHSTYTALHGNSANFEAWLSTELNKLAQQPTTK